MGMLLRSLHKYSFTICNRLFCKKVDEHIFPRQIFSAIQPTGEMHLGNYLGAIQNWVRLQDEEGNLILSIADLHSLTSVVDPKTLNDNIFLMAATVLACGINPEKSIFFQQSDVPQHSELCWILGTLTSMARLGGLAQFKDKTASMKIVPVGLYIYPILQAADIALYKATHVPVGQDQMQHMMIAHYLTQAFNRTFGVTFPRAEAIVEEETGNIRSLMEPHKKMSKSGPPRSYISLTDTPDDIVMKCKRAITDFVSEVTYDPVNRPGVSNLILIHSCLANKSVKAICEEASGLDTGKYKLVLAEFMVETLKPIREKMQRYMSSPEYLESVLRSGAEKAREKAEVTMKEVKHRIGIKVQADMPLERKMHADTLE